ncbi:hypothetical protein F4860DRAFT_521696 [Xylaria cubensis]|nr:hypothetical protein F4860DRAFT_521696 [Xylaria cubensis]
MDADRAPRDKEPIEPPPILRLSLDLIFCISDCLDIRDIYRLSKCSRSLRESLEYCFYMRNASSWNRRHAIEFVSYGIEQDFNIYSFRLLLNACRQSWPCLLDDMSCVDSRYWPLFVAIKKNRVDIVFLLEDIPNIFKVRSKTRYNITDLHIHFLELSPWQYGAGDSALEVAIIHKSLELTERFLANPEVSVRPVALCEALLRRWKPGIEAVLACGKLEQVQVIDILSRGLFHCHSHHQPDWIEYLVSIGADPQWSFPHRIHKRMLCSYCTMDANCWLHHRLPCVPFCRTVLSNSLAIGHLENVKKLFEIFSFSDDYMVYVLRQSIMGRQLEITKIILGKINLNSATWAEAYSTAVMLASDAHRKKEQIIRYLLSYSLKLQRLGADFDLNKPLGDSGETILERVLVHQMIPRPIKQWKQIYEIYGTSRSVWRERQGIMGGICITSPYECMNKQPRQDWVTPLFQFNIDASLLSTREWRLFRQYLYIFVKTKEKRDLVLNCCRRMMSHDRYRGVEALLSSIDREL